MSFFVAQSGRMGWNLALPLNDENKEEMMLIIRQESVKREEAIDIAWINANDIGSDGVWKKGTKELSYQTWAPVFDSRQS